VYNQGLKSFLQLININPSDLSSVKRHLLGLNIRPATLKSRLLVISILLTISSTCWLRCFQLSDVLSILCKPAKHCVAFNLKWMNSDAIANVTAHLSIGPKANGQKNSLVWLSFFYQYLWMISVDMLVISVVERCFRLRL